jgi:FAD/FMN-containing dehydrogenase
MIQPDSTGLYHPASEDDIIELVKYASLHQVQLRVRGAAQSVMHSIYTDGYDGNHPVPTENINIMLDQMRAVSFVENSPLVTVQAGCNLGYDPFDPSGTSKEKNGLYFQLLAKGLAIPNVSDAIHQTVGGYMSTSSSGGTMSHSFLDAVMSIRLIDGTGTLRVFNRPIPDNPDDDFYAVGVSLGLLGIITEVTLQCVPSFNVIGQQAITTDTGTVFDFFGNGSSAQPSLETYLTKTEFTRLIWWPFPTVRRVFTWQARTMQPSDYNKETGPESDFHPKPYQDAFYPSFLPEGLSGIPKEVVETATELIVSALFTAIGTWPKALTDLLGNETVIDGKTIDTSVIVDTIELAWPILLPHILNVFAPCDGKNPPQQFWDNWVSGLANDTNEYSNDLLPSHRTEFWVPVDQTSQVMKLLQTYYQDVLLPKGDNKNRNYANACYVVEILSAKNNPFWLSPAYEQDSLRICIYSLKQNDEDVKAFFHQFWEYFRLKSINYRLHWGYYLPEPSSDESAYNAAHYPRLAQFETLRNTMDPDNIFLTSYWQEQLNIAQPIHQQHGIPHD